MKVNFTFYLLLAISLMFLFAPNKDTEARQVPSTPKMGSYGVHFLNGKYADALAESKGQQKILFAAVSSRSCGECSAVANNLYNDPRVAELFNKEFVNFNLDIDRIDHFHLAGAQILEGKNRQSIKPTILFYNSDGYLLEKVSDIRSAQELIKKAEYIIGKYRRKADPNDMANVRQMMQERNAGRKDPKFLYDFALSLKYVGEAYNKAVNDYLATVPKSELANDSNRIFIYDFSDNINNDAILHFLDQLSYFKTGLGGASVNEHIKSAVTNSVGTAIEQRDQQLFQRAQEVVKRASLPDDQEFLYHIRSGYYEGIRDWDNFAQVNVRFIKEFNVTDQHFLDVVAEKFFLYVDDKGFLDRAEEWIKYSIAVGSEYDNNLIYAKILRKKGRYEDAKTAAMKAIEIAKRRNESDKAGIDYNEARNLIDQISGLNRQP